MTISLTLMPCIFTFTRFHRVTSIQCDNHSLTPKSFTTPAEEEASHGPVAVSKQHTTGEPGHPSTISIHEGSSSHHATLKHTPLTGNASSGLPLADTTGKTHAPKHDNFTHADAMHLTFTRFTVSRAFNATTTPSTPKSFTTPAEEEASHGPVAVSKQHTTGEPGHPSTISIHEGSSSHHATLKHTPLTGNASSGLPLADTTGKTHAPKHDNFTHADAHASSHSPGSTVSRAFNATTTPPHQNHLRHCRGRGFTWASSSFETTHDGGLPLADTTGKTHAPKHDNFTHADAHASSHSPGSTVSRAFNATTLPPHQKSFTTPAEEEASHGPVAVSKQHTTGEPGHPSTISIHEGSGSHHATLKHTPLTGNARVVCHLQTRRAKLMHQSMTISLTLMPMHLHIHPVPPCHEHSMRQPLPPHQIIYDTCRGRGFTWASSSFEQHTTDTTGKTHAPKHDNFTHADAHASSHSPGSTVSRAFNATTTPPHKIIYEPAEEEASHGPVAVSKQHTTAFNATTTPSTPKSFTTPAEEEASHGPVAVSKQHTTGEPGHPSTISIHEGSSSHHATLKHTPLTGNASSGLPLADTTGKTHAPKHDNFTHADAHASSHSPGSPCHEHSCDNHSLHTKSFTTPAEEELHMGHSHHATLKHTPLTGNASSGLPLADTTGKTHAPKHDNFTHADAHASSHSPGSTVSRAFNATTTPSTPKSFTTPAEEEASHGPVAVSKQHTTDTTGKTHAPKHDNFITLMPMHLHIHPVPPCHEHSMRQPLLHTKSFTTPAEQEASHGPVAVSKQHRRSIQCDNHSLHTKIIYDTAEEEASHGPVAVSNNTRRTRRAKLMHQSMTISLTLMPMHLHIHPVPPCHEHSMRQPLPPHQIIYDTCRGRGFTWASSSFETTHDGGLPLADTTGKTHAPKHDNFTHADAHASSHSPGSTVSRAFNATTTPSTPKSFTTPAEEEASHGPVAVSKQHTTGEPGHPSTISIHEGSSSHHATLKHTPLTGNASSGLPLADTTGKTHAPSMTISLTLMPMHLHIHPVPPCHEHSMRHHSLHTKSFTTPAEEEASHGPVAVSKQHTTGEPGHPSTISIHEGSSSHHATLKHTPLTGNASSGLPLADTTGKTHAPKHDNFTHADAHASSHSPGSTVSRAFNATTTPSTPKSFTTPAEEEASHGPVAVSKQHTTGEPGHPSTISIHEGSSSHHATLKHTPLTGNASSGLPLADTTGKTHAPKHDNFTHADAHASSHSPGSTVSRAFNATTTPSTPKSFTTPAEEEASHGPVAVSKQHTTGEPGHPSTISIHEGSSSHHATLKHTPLTGNASSGLPLADTTGKTHAPKHDNFTHADAHASSHSPGSTVSRAFNATTTPSTPKSFTTPAEEEASHGPVAVSKQHTTGEPGHPSTISIHEGSSSHHATLKHTPLTGNASSGLPLADTTGKTHAPKHDNFTHADAHASSHSPGSTVSRAFNATTTPSTPKSFTTPAEEEASHGPVAVSKQHTTGEPGHPSTISIHEGSSSHHATLKHTPLTGNASSGLPLADTTGKTHAPKHDNFTHADAHASSHSPGSTVSRAFNATTTPSTPNHLRHLQRKRLHMGQ
ncbi:hypothetical protein Fcan01_28191 [Folsomia candida]|uniref:Uncharacterized protein n=1 Tax=Folsomia candida TaxID=158441 RepID=A0A226CUA9_FOLCA|nr:hypothetical protein Fcan01_28191 [Folsomia candida]